MFRRILKPGYFQLIFFCTVLINLSACKLQTGEFAEMSSIKTLVQILEDAEFAITERNFRINNKLHIGKAIRERGEGGFPDYEVILFCNLSHAKKMLELAPDYITYCPQRLIVRDTGKHRIITAVLLPQNTSNSALNSVTAEINKLMREIVQYSATEWPGLDEN